MSQLSLDQLYAAALSEEVLSVMDTSPSDWCQPKRHHIPHTKGCEWYEAPIKAVIRCPECEPMCTCPPDCACKKGAR